jgi:translation initiation factor 1
MNSQDWKDKLGALLDQKSDFELQPDRPQAETSKPQAPITNVQNLTIGIDKKGRNGKTATIIGGFECPDADIKAIEKHLKATLGIGGSSRGDEILLQGDLRDKASALLAQWGHKVKRRN